MSVALPPRVRAVAYLVTAVLGVLLSSVQAAFLALGAQPAWLIAAWAAYGPIAAALGVMAAANTHPEPPSLKPLLQDPGEVPPWQH